MQVVVSKMKYCLKKGKGIPMKPVVSAKVYVHKAASYTSVLKKIREALYGNDASVADDSSNYYLADSMGYPVCNNGKITMQDEDGGEREVSWTIETFMKMSNIKYQSKLKLFCVAKESLGI